MRVPGQHTSASRHPAVQARRAERRRKLLAAGIEVFGDRGYANSSVTLLCHAAGLARAQFYEHFDNREDLLLAVYDMIQEQARHAVSQAVAEQADDVVARAHAAMTAFAESVGHDPRRARLVFVEVIGVSERAEQHRVQSRELWVRYIAEQIAHTRGADYCPPGGYTAAATGFIGALMALVHQWSLGSADMKLTDAVEVLTHFLISLINPESMGATGANVVITLLAEGSATTSQSR
ncbi:TetR/AcrR family transcriptional regulator [Nocardia terpenica]|uniref:TetR/AcrR family transcriptional regulator n=1 Tax=Nocardia terpenica TaxID=455432 RepID=UPI0002F480B5|nr:TetR/AcrR family transcriptional regulator [Nocardia terpenica]NQE91202.1 TetR/AcrR family transcriptional regulator [Nocardia terpenica]